MRDIKSAKTLSGKDVLWCLELPVSAFFTMSANDEPKTLTVVIDKPTPDSSISNAKEIKISGWNKMIGKMKPSYCDFESAWSVDEVKKFLQRYIDAPNKGNYLSSFKSGQKPSILNQIEAFVVQFLNKEGVQYKGGTGGEEKRAMDGLSSVVKLVHFLHEHRDTLGRKQSLTPQS